MGNLYESYDDYFYDSGNSNDVYTDPEGMTISFDSETNALKMRSYVVRMFDTQDTTGNDILLVPGTEIPLRWTYIVWENQEQVLKDQGLATLNLLDVDYVRPVIIEEDIQNASSTDSATGEDDS